MAKIKQLVAEFRNNKTKVRRKGIISHHGLMGIVMVQWDESSCGLFTAVNSTEWRPIKLYVIYSDSHHKIKPLQDKSPAQAWAAVYRHRSRLAGGPIEQRRLSEELVKIEEEERKKYLNSHPLIPEILKRHPSHASSAVIIFTGSWLDKTLDAVYNAKRGEDKKDPIDA